MLLFGSAVEVKSGSSVLTVGPIGLTGGWSSGTSSAGPSGTGRGGKVGKSGGKGPGVGKFGITGGNVTPPATQPKIF